MQSEYSDLQWTRLSCAHFKDHALSGNNPGLEVAWQADATDVPRGLSWKTICQRHKVNACGAEQHRFDAADL
jgi:hypothetical protein